jgi:tRNA(His) 5'-end guanylyltransferase
MSSSDSLGDRMKEYEGVPRTTLMRRVPVMMRLDGKAFHTFTKGLPRPYCRPFHECMWAAAKYLCENIQGAQVAYVQSDEIQLLLTDYADIKTEAWYDYQVQKMTSVAAAMCSVAFAAEYTERMIIPNSLNLKGPIDTLKRRLPAFDCRVWNLPKDEVVNVFIWRQQDATRNAIQMAGQSQFSHGELHGVNCDQIQEKLFQERSINFNDYPVPQKRGVCIVKEKYEVVIGAQDYHPGIRAERWRWVVDENIPIFTQDRDYIQKFV